MKLSEQAFSILRCPMTGESLRHSGSRLIPEGTGGVEYPVEGGIIDMRCFRKDYYFNPVPREQMEALTHRAATQPWFRTIREFMGHVRNNPDWLDNLTSDGRYAWKLFLDLRRDAVVLDLGCGLGNLSRSLAPHVHRVYAMDLTIERLRFAKRRFSNFDVGDNITLIAGGDGTRLPFSDQSLDLVTLSGVLEWVADDDRNYGNDSKWVQAARMASSMFGPRNPRAVQTGFLREIRRVLKPDGQLFIAIENRYNLAYFKDRVDHHSGLWFGSLLPRFVSNLYSIAAVHRPYRTYTYSLGGYRRLLKAAGFARPRFIGLTPGYTHLAEITEVDNSPNRWRSPAVTSWKEQLRRHPRFIPAYGIISGSARESVLERIVTRIEGELGAHQLMAESFRISGKAKGILKLAGREFSYIVKLPFNADAIRGLQRQHSQMRVLFSENARFKQLLPESLATGNHDGVDYFVERSLNGTPLGAIVRRGLRGEHLAAIENLFSELDAVGATKASLEGEFFRAEVEEPLAAIEAALEGAESIMEFSRTIKSRLTGVVSRRGLVHGDFSASNVLFDGTSVSGVIDWEYSRLDGLRILDAINFLDSVQRHRESSHSLVDTVFMLARGDWPVAAEWEFLMRAFRDCDTDSTLHPEFAYLYWAHHVASQLEGGLIYDAKQIERRVERFLVGFFDDSFSRSMESDSQRSSACAA